METTVEVSEQSQVAEVRRVSAQLGRRLGMSEADLGRVALVATEVSTNLVKYAKSGMVTVSAFEEAVGGGVQIVAVDKGPGFANFAASSRDGYSTGGSLGIGLGVIKRASDVFDVYTAESLGSALLSRVAKDGIAPQVAEGGLWLGSRSSPKLGESACGDAWGYRQTGSRLWLCMVDGLGHGPLAADAAHKAIGVFNGARESDSAEGLLARCHEGLKSTRGAVMGILAIDTLAGIGQFAGVGNIIGAIYLNGQTQHLLSVEGIVGYNTRSLRSYQCLWTREAVVILGTDGLSSRWNMARYPGLLARHPALVASVMYRDLARNNDDATVVVAKGSA